MQYTSQATDPAVWSTLAGCGTMVSGGRVIVTASAPFQVITPLVSAVVGQTITLRESSEVVVQ